MMDKQLRQDIGENYGSEFWKPITAKQYPYADASYQLFVFDHDVEHDKKTYRCVIVQRVEYDGHTEDVDYAEDVFADAWQL